MGGSVLADITAQMPESQTHLTQVPAQSVVTVNKVGSSGRRNAELEGGAMAGKRRSDRALRPVLQRSPGRPGVGQRDTRRRFWAVIALG
jgi:hypothetical protein